MHVGVAHLTARTTAVSLPSAACTGLVTTSLTCVSNVLPVVLTAVCTNPNFSAFVTFTCEAQFTRDGIQNFHNLHLWAGDVISPSSSEPVLVVIIYSDPTYFKTGLQGRIGELPRKQYA
jgi:hypothetical protein